MDLLESGSAARPRHPWERARFAFFEKVLRGAGLTREGSSFLDVGAGDAWFASELAASSRGVSVVCWDTGYVGGKIPAAARDNAALRFCEARPGDRFDTVLLLDVLEHVEDDRTFLRELVASNVRPGGALLLSVPAWQALFSSHDAFLGHHRRYRPAGCREVVAGAGLEIVQSGGVFLSLLPVRALQAAAERARLVRRQRHAGEWNGSGALTQVVGAMLRWDTALSLSASRLGLELPGLSWWALCRRRS